MNKLYYEINKGLSNFTQSFVSYDLSDLFVFASSDDESLLLELCELGLFILFVLESEFAASDFISHGIWGLASSDLNPLGLFIPEELSLNSVTELNSTNSDTFESEISSFT